MSSVVRAIAETSSLTSAQLESAALKTAEVKLKRPQTLAIWLRRVSMVSVRKLLRTSASSLLGSPLLPAMLAVVFASGFASPVEASDPRVQFDLPYQVVCVDVTSAEFAQLHPGERLIEARLPFSMLLVQGRANDVSQVTLRASSPHATMLIADYLPKTLHAEQTLGGVEVRKEHETTASIGVNLAGKVESMTGIGAETGMGEKWTNGSKYQLLPPRETVVASGKMARGAGVYIKLVASERHPWEGEREIVLILRVPAAWRADYLHVRCEADGVRRGIVKQMDESIRVAQRDFLVTLCQSQDEQARYAADELARAEAELRRAVMTSHGDRRESISLLGGAISIPTGSTPSVSPQVWLGDFLFAGLGRGKIPASLPREVKEAATRFQQARSEVWQMTGWGGSAVSSTPQVTKTAPQHPRVEVLRPVATSEGSPATGWTSRERQH